MCSVSEIGHEKTGHCISIHAGRNSKNPL